MTTIEEMDEFFNFEDAAHSLDQNDMDFSHLQSGPYDIDLAFAEPENDENSFTCLQHFSAQEDQLSMGLNDTAMMGPHDFTDFPRWIEGMDVPTQPCASCRRMRIHCKVIKEGLRKGSCTSCVALARSCSLTHPNPHADNQVHDANMSSQSFGLPGDTVDDSGELNFSDWSLDRCNNCRVQGLECKISQRDPQGSCVNCVSFVMPCSLAIPLALTDWNSDDAPKLNDSLVSTLDDSLKSASQRGSSSSLVLQSSDDNMNPDLGERGPKIGARFSRESIRILRGWLSTHQSHPYPSDEEKEILQRQTGLNKTQITNWLANARRRGKVRAPRSTSPSVRGFSDAMDIPRRATPALENMNPLERWKHSPPEHEPASVTAIAKAVTASTLSSGRDSPYTSQPHTDDGSARSLWNVSSTSSLGTSNSHGSKGSSGNSFASAYSHKSRGSFGSFGSFGNRGRRRRRRQAPNPVKVSTTAAPARTFQCTFCTETFKTKHDWQRHEKSLHLSLERWVCCPNGPTQFFNDHNRCVFCGIPNPPADHAETHNYSGCAERTLEERTFYRKDHLRQHLNLVHDIKFQAYSMEGWKVVTPEIRSRCGFCGVIMDSWSFRVDHLAEHFKGGKSMADWKGDWGFEPQVLDIVENGMPPYLIHDERNSMNPFEPSNKPPQADRTVEDVVKIGLVEYVHEQHLQGTRLTDEDLLVVARNIINTADKLAGTLGDPECSWFRNLIMLYGTTEDEVPGYTMTTRLPWAQKLEKIATKAPHTTIDLETISCTEQRSLMAFVKAKQALGLTPTDRELQFQCCRILDEIEITCNYKCKVAVAWFKYLINSSTSWLREFRRCAGLPRSSEMASEQVRSTDDRSIDYSIHNNARLENELKEWTALQLSLGITPSDDDIQRQARLIVYKNDDPWNQTALDNPAILHLFKHQSGLAPTDECGAGPINLPPLTEACVDGCEDKTHEHGTPSSHSLHWDITNNWIGIGNPVDFSTRPYPSSGKSSGKNSGKNSVKPSREHTATGASTPNLDPPLYKTVQNQPSTNSNPTQPLKYFLNDANCYGRLVRELSRFVTTCTSPNNPNQHIPSDAEIQNQARWVIYDDDDPWNQTAADNAEWLIRFKRDVGLAPQESGPGLPFTAGLSTSWMVAEGGSGFSPPYLCPKQPIGPFVEDVPVTVNQRTFNIKATTAAKFVEGFGQRWQKPATVFCSRDLESGLNEFVRTEMAKGGCPSDEALRAKAREILGVDQTAADDVQLLEKFKAMHGITGNATQPGDSIPTLDDQMLAEFDQELGNMDLSGLEMPASSISLLDASIPEIHSLPIS